MPKKGEFDGRIWPTILEFNLKIDEELTSKANFLFGASTLILFFVLNKMLSPEFLTSSFFIKLAWGILFCGSFLSFLASMMIVLPKLRYFSQKERLREDIFYYKNIQEHYSRAEYLKYLIDLPTDEKRIGLAYAHQIYSLATHILPYKFRVLKIAGWILVVSVLTSTLLFSWHFF